MSRTQGEILRAALAHLEVAQSYAARDPDDQVVVDAICLRLSAAVERLASLDLAVREEIFGSDWPLMWGMRNRIAHGYELVHADIIRATLSLDPPVNGRVGWARMGRNAHLAR